MPGKMYEKIRQYITDNETPDKTAYKRFIKTTPLAKPAMGKQIGKEIGAGMKEIRPKTLRKRRTQGLDYE